MTVNSEAHSLDRAARTAIINRGFGLERFKPALPLVEGEGVTFISPTGRQYVLETRVFEVTDWEDER